MILRMKNTPETPILNDANSMYYTILSLSVSQSSSHYEY